MRKLPYWLTVVAIVVSACGYRSGSSLEPVGGKRIVGSEEATSHAMWMWSPYSRLTDDPNYPKFVLIASDGTGCLVPGAVWALAQPGVRLTCPDAWRSPRRR
jgi:hypothetical protein